MSWLYLVFVLTISYWPLVILTLVIVGLLLLVTGTIGVGGLFAAAERRGTLTCWHCGEETPAGPRHCTHCHGELQ